MKIKNNFCLYRAGPRPSLFPPDLMLYVNLVAKGAPKFFKTLAPRLTVLDIPYFADAFSRTVRPIDLHNFLRPIPITQSVMIQLYNTALARSTNFPYTSVLFDHSVGFTITLCMIEKSIQW
jgi:hypothetical protein